MIEKIQHKDCAMSGNIFWVFFFSALAANTAMATQEDGVTPSANGETPESEHKESAPSSSPETEGGGDLDQGGAAESANGESQEDGVTPGEAQESEHKESAPSSSPKTEGGGDLDQGGAAESANGETQESEGGEVEEVESDEDEDADAEDDDLEGGEAESDEDADAEDEDSEKKEGAKAKDGEKESAKEIDDFDFSNAEFNNSKEETGTGSIFK